MKNATANQKDSGENLRTGAASRKNATMKTTFQRLQTAVLADGTISKEGRAELVHAFKAFKEEHAALLAVAEAAGALSGHCDRVRAVNLKETGFYGSVELSLDRSGPVFKTLTDELSTAVAALADVRSGKAVACGPATSAGFGCNMDGGAR